VSGPVDPNSVGTAGTCMALLKELPFVNYSHDLKLRTVLNNLAQI
jgi:hypothetical protein